MWNYIKSWFSYFYEYFRNIFYDLESNGALQYLDLCIEKLENIEDESSLFSISYLKRKDVRQRFTEILNRIEADELQAKFHKILDVTFIKIEVTSINGDKYLLDLWPSTNSSCIGYEKYNSC